jgi:hypothetical protein
VSLRSGIASLVLILGVLDACAKPAGPPCGGARCPADYVCASGDDAGSPSCVVASGACGDKPDGTRCEGQGRQICVAGACVVSGCGDGYADPVLGELCDLGSGNSLEPNAPCRQAICKPAACGDKVIDGPGGRGEACDNGPSNSDFLADACRGDCASSRCGDGVLDTAEAPSCLAPDAQLVSLPDSPETAATGDIDGDGLGDIVTLDGVDTTAEIVMLFGRLDGGLDEVDRSVPASVASVSLCDVDADGDLDVMVIDTAKAVWIYTNLGARSLSIGQVVIPQALAATCADADGDGDADVAAALPTGSVAVRLHDASGFAAAQTFAVPDPAVSVALADVTWDGLIDLVVAQDGRVDLLPGKAGGGYDTPITVDTSPNEAFALTTADLDGDGHLDVIGESVKEADIRVWLARGAAGFATPADYPVFLTTAPVVADDLDGDGNIDLCMTAAAGLQVLRGSSTGALTPEAVRPEGGSVSLYASVDLDHDGYPDLIGTNFDGLVVNYGGDAPIGPPRRIADVVANETFTGDFVGDGGVQLLVFDTGNAWTLTPVAPGGRAGVSVPLTGPGGPLGIATGDFDGDGTSDVAFAHLSNIEIDDVVGNALVAKASLNVGFKTARLLAVDVEGDAVPELIAMPSFGGTELDVLGLSAGQLTKLHAVTASNGDMNEPSAFAADVDGDGLRDLVALQLEGVVLHRGLAPGGFDDGAVVLVPDCISMAFGDLDGDGDVDLVVAPSQGDLVAFMQTAPAVFTEGFRLTTTADLPRLVDLNGDGHLDLFTGDFAADDVLFGDGHGGFSPPLTVGNSPTAIVDLTGDGRPDLVQVAPGMASGVFLRATRVRRDLHF